ncbi:hypothetical protein ACIRPK_35870 [Kitasatospora sp. NPDC101801]|uniref:hypothetical protein n=1 Tax=Kitasatospora sp. NPDC101801 TaxID=3364103 RepID=UPI0037F4F151
MTTYTPAQARDRGYAVGQIGAFDLALAILGQDGQAVAQVIQRLRTAPLPSHCAYSCEQQLNLLLTEALEEAGVRAHDIASTMPTDTLAERITVALDSLPYPAAAEHAIAALVAGDIDPMRRLHGTPGLLARAVAVVGLRLVVWSRPRLKGLLEAERARYIRFAGQ